MSSARPTIILHIGAMKTGTTFLQNLMIANREAMAEAGFPFAGAAWPQQVRATQDVLHLQQDDPKIRQLSQGQWKKLSEEMLAAEGTPVMSMEFLSFAGAPGIRRIRRDLAGADVHVVLTVRDAQSVFPTQWQTSITSGAMHPWGQFQHGVRRAGRVGWQAHYMRDSSVRELRRTQDVAAILKRWLAFVPPDRLHVVTVPLEQGDKMELWRRFCDPFDIDPEIATAPAKHDNPSLGFASTELVRRINTGLVVAPMDYNRTVKDHLSAKVLSKRRHDEGRPQMDRATQKAALAWNARSVAAIEHSGVNVIGSLEDLPTSGDLPTAGERTPSMPSDAEIFDAAGDAARGLATLITRRRRRVRNKGGAVASGDVLQPDWVEDGHPSDLSRAVTDLTALAQEACDLRARIFALNQLRGE